MKNKARPCADLHTLYETSTASAIQIDGNQDGQNQSDADAAAADQAANETRDMGQKAGCGWAA
jgi:hypothetical protein